MDSEIIKLYKEIGETPLECIGRFREDNPEYQEVKMTYLGRLDPMAEGLLLVLSGNTRGKEKHLALDKTYEFEVLWGVSTDTYDILGLVSDVNPNLTIKEREILGTAAKIANLKSQSYPAYSSRTVGGKPLWELAREGKIEEVDVPTRSIKIFNIEHVQTRLADSEEILRDVGDKISKVKGNFRQEEILNSWESGLKRDEKFLISKLVADVSTGTYIRGLASEMGKILGVPALAYSIKRTRVEEYEL